MAAKQGEVTIDLLKGSKDGDVIALYDRNDAASEQWREVFVTRVARSSTPHHFLLMDASRKLLDEPTEGAPKGIISDADEDHSLFAEFGVYYKSPPIEGPPAAINADPAAATTPAGPAIDPAGEPAAVPSPLTVFADNL